MKKNIQTKDEALDQVRQNNEQEYKNLFEFAEEWVAKRMRPFTSEDLKLAYYDAGNPEPKQLNIFGAAVNALASKKKIIFNGTADAKLPKAHGRLLRVWISKQYSELQSNNRKAETNQVSLFNMSS